MKDKCKTCKYFDNTKPTSTIRGKDKPKFAEEYIGICKQIGRIKMMNDICLGYKSKEVK